MFSFPFATSSASQVSTLAMNSSENRSLTPAGLEVIFSDNCDFRCGGTLAKPISFCNSCSLAAWEIISVFSLAITPHRLHLPLVPAFLPKHWSQPAHRKTVQAGTSILIPYNEKSIPASASLVPELRTGPAGALLPKEPSVSSAALVGGPRTLPLLPIPMFRLSGMIKAAIATP